MQVEGVDLRNRLVGCRPRDLCYTELKLKYEGSRVYQVGITNQFQFFIARLNVLTNATD